MYQIAYHLQTYKFNHLILRCARAIFVDLWWNHFAKQLKIDNTCWSASCDASKPNLLNVTIYQLSLITANFYTLFALWPVCHRRSGGHVNSRRLPQLDQNEFSVSRVAGANRGQHFISFRFAEFVSGWHLLFPIDRSLCRIDIDHVFGILPNHCYRMVLWHSSTIEKYSANDRKATITILSIMLARHWTGTAVCKFNSMRSVEPWTLIILTFLICQSVWVFSLFNYKPPTYDNEGYEYPTWAHALGWFYAAISLICIPIFAVVAIVRADGNTLFQVKCFRCNFH